MREGNLSKVNLKYEGRFCGFFFCQRSVFQMCVRKIYQISSYKREVPKVDRGKKNPTS